MGHVLSLELEHVLILAQIPFGLRSYRNNFYILTCILLLLQGGDGSQNILGIIKPLIRVPMNQAGYHRMSSKSWFGCDQLVSH